MNGKKINENLQLLPENLNKEFTFSCSTKSYQKPNLNIYRVVSGKKEMLPNLKVSTNNETILSENGYYFLQFHYSVYVNYKLSLNDYDTNIGCEETFVNYDVSLKDKHFAITIGDVKPLVLFNDEEKDVKSLKLIKENEKYKVKLYVLSKTAINGKIIFQSQKHQDNFNSSSIKKVESYVIYYLIII